MILLDYSSVMMSSIFSRIESFDDDLELLRHQIFNIIRLYNVKHRSEFGEMVLCMDGAKNWRREQFPFYKANRRKSRNNSVHDWDNIYKVLNQVREEISTMSPFRCIRVDRCEADDVIANIVEKQTSPSPILIISPDRDFIQLHKFPNVKQFSNIQKKWLEPVVSPEYDLKEKILKGDVGDGVPNVMSDDNVLVEETSRQTPLRKVKLESLLKDPESLGTTIARRVIRNRTLIDLSRTPDDIKVQIDTEYAKPVEGSINSLMSLFTKKKMKLLLECLPDFETNK
jgi:hypothetical protein|tara:strand:- start:2924 stop:3775 length:852 start_codon:yes stop_codon:yes gene_type:complete